MNHTETNEQIDPIKHAIKQAVRFILQTEIADEVWYQDRGCEEKLQKGLADSEEKLTEYIRSLRQSDKENLISKMEGLKSTEWGCTGRNNGIDTCKSIVEEVMK